MNRTGPTSIRALDAEEPETVSGGRATKKPKSTASRGGWNELTLDDTSGSGSGLQYNPESLSRSFEVRG